MLICVKLRSFILVKTVRNDFLSEEEKIEYVKECDNAFERELDRVSRSIIEMGDTRFVTLSGPTCSCKTTTVKKIIADVIDAGKKIKIISIDDFFKSRNEDRKELLKVGKAVDFDTLNALDFDYLCECTDLIMNGKKAMLPEFDFNTARRKGYVEFDPSGYDIIVYEGIQAIYPEVRQSFSRYSPLSLFINVEGPVKCGKEVFSGREVRLCRRIVRDSRFRNAAPEFTMFMWDSVTENEDKNMLPYADTAKIRIDSFIPYELNLIKEPLCDLLKNVPCDSDYYNEACRLICKFDGVTPIDPRYIPDDSMYREFLG